MTKLFKKIDDAERRTVNYKIMLTEKESAEIANAAKIRNLSIAAYFRRVALGRRADIHYETEQVLVLREVVMALRELYAYQVAHGMQPPKEAWRPVITEAIAAIKRVSRVGQGG